MLFYFLVWFFKIYDANIYSLMVTILVSEKQYNAFKSLDNYTLKKIE